MASTQSRPHSSQPHRLARRIIWPEIRKVALAMVASGMKATHVARQLGFHPSRLSCWKAEGKHLQGHRQLASPAPEAGEGPKAPPRQTGRYSQPFKEDVLAQVRSGRKLVEVARQYQLSEKTISRWLEEAKASGGELPDPKSTRPPTNASPIDEEHRALVLSLKEKHPNMGPAQLQNQLKRFYALKLSRQLIGRIFVEAGIPLQKRGDPEEGSDPSKNRFEMSRPNELWAVDFKEIWIHSEKAHGLFFLDDFSRFVTGFALTQHPSAELAIETLRQAIQRHGRPERLLSDRGPQFHAWNGVSQFDEFLGEFLTDHTVTKAHHPFTLCLLPVYVYFVLPSPSTSCRALELHLIPCLLARPAWWSRRGERRCLRIPAGGLAGSVAAGFRSILG